MAQFSIGICTPVPLVPVDGERILKEKVREAALRLEAGDQPGCLQSLQESLVRPATTEQHLGLITPEWQRARSALQIPPGHGATEVFADGMEVGVARCAAVECARQAGLKMLFFCDWDVLIPADALLKLSYFLDNNPEYDIAAGMYCMKSIPPFPLIWKEWNAGVLFDFTVGDVLKEGIVGIPMGCTLLRLSLFDHMPHTPDNPWFQTVNKPVLVGGRWGRMMMTEDLWMTKRYTDEVDKEHRKIMVDTGIWCEHICHATGKRYTLGDDTLPVRRLREKSGQFVSAREPVILHVGCGTAALPPGFSGWKEVRLDIDPAVKPDIVGSITKIAFEDGKADALYCSHNLEHLSEAEVPLALAEFFRVLRPGGRMLIEVPDVQAVAEAIPNIGLDGVLYQSPAGPISPADVLYGLRSAVAKGNEFYRHKCGFDLAKLQSALTAAGFADVLVERQTETYALQASALRS